MIGGHAKSIAESYNPQCVRYIAVSLSEQFNSWVVDVGATISKYTYVRNQCADYVSTHICKLTYIHERYAEFKQCVQTLPFVGHICHVPCGDYIRTTICKYTYVRNRYVDFQHGVRMMHLAEAKT